MARTTKVHDGKTKPIIETDDTLPGGHRVGMASAPGANGFLIAPSGAVVAIQTAPIDFNTSGDHPLIVGTASKKTRVIGVHAVCAGAVGVGWKSSGGTVLVPSQAFATNGALSIWWPQGSFAESVVGEGVTLNLSGAVQVSGVAAFITY